MSRFAKPSVANRQGQKPGVAGTDPAFEKAYPALHEYLTLAKWDDGKPRETATLLFFCEDGWWKIMVKDRANARLAFFSGCTWAETLELVDKALECDNVEWRADKQWGGKKKG